MPPWSGPDAIFYATSIIYGIVIAWEVSNWQDWAAARLGPPRWRRDFVAEAAFLGILWALAAFWPFTAPIRKIARAYARHDTPATTNYDEGRE